MTFTDLFDPKGLIQDAFAIDNISAPECRSIFLDWALGVPTGRDVQHEARLLLAHYGPTAPATHPMILTLTAALPKTQSPRRRGGRQGRKMP